jgi:putative aldouronate transport system permease protein
VTVAARAIRPLRIRMRESPGERAFGVANVAFLVVLMILMVYPLLFILFASLSNATELTQHRGLLFAPIDLTFEAYRRVLQNPLILSGYRNTLFIVIVGTSLNVFMTALGAYALSRRNVLFKNPVMFFIVFTMFFSGGLIPSYLLIGQTLHMQDTLWALIVPGAVSTLNLIIMRTAFNAVPVSLEEAARMDGANDWTILFRIVIPLSWPVVAVMILFYGVGHWNAFFSALVYLRDRDLYPLQLVLREILITSNVQNMTTDVSGGDVQAIGETIKYATIIVATVPILLVYPYLQRYFVKGVTIGAIKE